MLHHHLQSAINDLRSLLEITHSDIADIKEARHDNLFSRIKAKEELITAFETKKALIDNEIAKLAKANPASDLSELLPDSIRELLDQLRQNLQELKKLNKHYARLVLAVSEFYNSLLERLIPQDTRNYAGANRPSSFLAINA